MPSNAPVRLDVRGLAISRGFRTLRDLARAACRSRSVADAMQAGSVPSRPVLDDFASAAGISVNDLVDAIAVGRERREKSVMARPH